MAFCKDFTSNWHSSTLTFSKYYKNVYLYHIFNPFAYFRVKLRIKTDAKQFEIKDDPMEEEVATDDNTSAIQRDNESGLKQNQVQLCVQGINA